jgi:ABC-type phosphate transport system substrate-binding protein
MRAHSLLFILALITSPLTWADLLLIVNSKNSTVALERKQVIDIFMGRTTVFPNQQPAHTLDVVNSKNLRAVFYKNLTGKNEAQVDAYWATLVFAGRMLPPEKLPDEAAVINAVKNNSAAIGYITRQTLPEGIKVVLEIPTTQ